MLIAKAIRLLLVIIPTALFVLMIQGHQSTVTPVKFTNIKIADVVLKAELADTVLKQKLGLSGRKNLPNDQGMLFVFAKKAVYPFWNKDLLFPIDVIWIDQDAVVAITQLPIIADKPITYTPQNKANLVLEVNAGFVKKYNIKLGTKVLYSP